MIKQVTKAERINYLFTFNTIAGLDPVEVEIKQYVDKYRPVQSVAIQHDPNWQDGVRFSGDGRWIMPNTSLV